MKLLYIKINVLLQDKYITLMTNKCNSRRICTADIVVTCKGMIFGPTTFAKLSMLILFCFSYIATFFKNSMKNAKVFRLCGGKRIQASNNACTQ